jgi:hypothetical protein
VVTWHSDFSPVFPESRYWDIRNLRVHSSLSLFWAWPKSKFCCDRRQVPTTRFFLLSDRCGFGDVGRPHWQEDESIVYICCWPSPAQPLRGSSPIFYCLRFETSPTWRAKSQYLYPPGTEWSSHTLRHWVPFSPPRRAIVECLTTNDFSFYTFPSCYIIYLIQTPFKAFINFIQLWYDMYAWFRTPWVDFRQQSTAYYKQRYWYY